MDLNGKPTSFADIRLQTQGSTGKAYYCAVRTCRKICIPHPSKACRTCRKGKPKEWDPRAPKEKQGRVEA